MGASSSLGRTQRKGRSAAWADTEAIRHDGQVSARMNVEAAAATVNATPIHGTRVVEQASAERISVQSSKLPCAPSNPDTGSYRSTTASQGLISPYYRLDFVSGG